MSEEPKAPMSPEPKGASSPQGNEEAREEKSAQDQNRSGMTNSGRSEEETGSTGEFDSQRSSTGTLIHRFTGSLRRVSGRLGAAGSRHQGEPSGQVRPEPGSVEPEKLEAAPKTTANQGDEEGVMDSDLGWIAEIRQEAADQENTPPVVSGARDEGIDIPEDRLPMVDSPLGKIVTGTLKSPDSDKSSLQDVVAGRFEDLDVPPATPVSTSPQETAPLPEESLPDDRFNMFGEISSTTEPLADLEAEVWPESTAGENLYYEEPVVPISPADIWADEPQAETPGWFAGFGPLDENLPGAAQELEEAAETPGELPPAFGQEDAFQPLIETGLPAAKHPEELDMLGGLDRMSMLEEQEEYQPLDSVAPVSPAEEETTGFDRLSMFEPLSSTELESQEPQAVPEPPAAEAQPEAADEMSGLRESLAEEEYQTRKRGSGFFSRLTGALRRAPGGMDKGKSPEDLGLPPVLEPSQEEEIGDDFVTGRLAGPVPSYEDLYREAVEPEIDRALNESEEAYPDWMTNLSDEEVQDTAGLPSPTTVEEPPLPEPSFDRPRGFTGQLRSFVTNLLRGSEERAQKSSADDLPDEMVTGRLERTMVTGQLARPKRRKTGSLGPGQEGTGDGQAEGAEEGESERPRGVTGQLRSFITTILRSSEERRRKTGELPGTDELVTGGLGQGGVTGGLVEESEPPARADEASTLTPEMPPGFVDITSRLDAKLYEEVETPFTAPEAPKEPVSDEDFLLNRFDMLYGEQTPAQEQEPGTFTIDESLIWDTSQPLNAEQPPQVDISAEELWGQPDEEGQITEAAYSQEDSGYIFESLTDEELISSFLTGQLYPIDEEQEQPEGEPGVEGQAEGDVSAYNVRSIALEGYQDTLERPVVTEAGVESVPEMAFPELEFEDEPLTQPGLRGWLAARTGTEKVLLVEGAVVVLALLVAVPFFLFMIIRGPLEPPAPVVASAPFVQRELPAGVPYPNGLTLPGGWFFALGKSTFVDGKWQPKTSEWLVGSEVRRVVALPWNPQTEAVIETLKPGDSIGLRLTNSDELVYVIESVERVPVDDASVFTDRKRSLVIILYQEDAAERWVVVSRP